jgi:hypothetical protein
MCTFTMLASPNSTSSPSCSSTGTVWWWARGRWGICAQRVDHKAPADTPTSKRTALLQLLPVHEGAVGAAQVGELPGGAGPGQFRVLLRHRGVLDTDVVARPLHAADAATLHLGARPPTESVSRQTREAEASAGPGRSARSCAATRAVHLKKRPVHSALYRTPPRAVQSSVSPVTACATSPPRCAFKPARGACGLTWSANTTPLHGPAVTSSVSTVGCAAFACAFSFWAPLRGGMAGTGQRLRDGGSPCRVRHRGKLVPRRQEQCAA